MRYRSTLLLSIIAFATYVIPHPVYGDIGLLPAFDYSADKGFGYGILFQYDDKRNPEYQPYFLSHRVIIQRTTRGIANYEYRLDSKYLLPSDLRLTFEIKYEVNFFEPYHGPGGAQTLFNQDFIDEDSPDYRGKHYYTYDKRSFQANFLTQGNFRQQDLRWLAGFIVLSAAVDTIDYNKYDEPDSLQTLLAHHYDLHQRDMDGGNENGIMLGVVWDRRDQEYSPHKGLWSEALLRWVPGITGNDYSYIALTATHRHYFALSDPLTLALRLSGRIMSEGAPFFSLSRLDGSFKTETAVGGKKTVRGILWQRMLARHFLYGNAELRYQIIPLFSDGYLAGSVFYDFGRTFDEQQAAVITDRDEKHDRWHQGAGFGIRLAQSSTFIVALDIAFPIDKTMDGPGSKLYIGLDWLF